MLFVVEILPLCLNGGIALHVHMTLAPLEAVLLIDGYQGVEKQGIGTLGTVFGQHTDQEQIDDIRLMELQGADDMPPAERQEATLAALLQGFGQRGNGDAHADNIMVGRVPVLNDTKHIHGEELEILMHISVDLALRHLGIAIEVGEGLVHHVEHLLAV